MANSTNLIQHGSSVIPVTALHSVQINSYVLLLSGEGSFIKVFDLKSQRLLAKSRLFRSHVIHGFASVRIKSQRGDYILVLIWGGNSICLLEIREDLSHGERINPSFSFRFFKPFRSPDWVLDVCFQSPEIEQDESAVAALITANNVLNLISIINGQVKFRLVASSSRSMLYSAHLQWISNDHILVASGTVFGEVILWSCHGDPNAILTKIEEARVSKHQVFTGHEGSIFGVQISPEYRSNSSESPPTRLLASCSDDRTIRIWNISEFLGTERVSSTSDSTQENDSHPELYETGFGQNLTAELQNSSPITKAWGHASRIWGVQFIASERYERGSASTIDIISYGEDATVQQWQIFPGVDELVHNYHSIRDCRLENKKIFRQHVGKNIWALTLLTGKDGLASAISGGADGRISLTPLHDINETSLSQCRISSWSVLDVEESSQGLSTAEIGSFQKTQTVAKVSKKPDDVFRLYAHTSEQEYVALTAKGRVFICQSSASDKLFEDETDLHIEMQVPSLRWSEIGSNNAKTFTAIAACKGTDLVFLSSDDKSFSVLDLSDKSLSSLCHTRGKVAAIFTQFLIGMKDSIAVLVSYFDESRPELLCVQKSPDKGATISSRYQVHLPHEFCPTSFSCFAFSDFMIIGSRSGSYVSIKSPFQPFSELVSLPGATDSALHFIFEQSCHQDAIVSVIDMVDINTHAYFMTISRDGTYAIHHRCVGDVYEKSTLVHLSCPKLLPILTGGYFDPESHHLFLYGFLAKDFIVWNETLQSEIARHDMNGVRWPCEFSASHHSDQFVGRLAYTHAKTHVSVELRGSLSNQVQRGGFGREVKCLAFRNVPVDNYNFTDGDTTDEEINMLNQLQDDMGTLLAVGGEDCTVQLVALRNEGLECIGTFKRHNTGVQSVKWSGDGRYLFSCGGQSEFYVWLCDEIPEYGYGVVFQAEIKRDDGDIVNDVRILDFDIVETGADPLASLDDGYIVTLVTSTSLIEAWHFNKVEQEFVLLGKTQYTSCAIAQVSTHLSDRALHIFIGATDGYISFYKMNTVKQDIANSEQKHDRTEPRLSFDFALPNSTIRLHQSTIKALLVMEISQSSKFLVVTGGDDNALHVSLCHDPTAHKPFLRRLSGCFTAHAAAITSLTLLEMEILDSGGVVLLFVSVGNDSEVKLWRFITPGNGSFSSREGEGCSLACIASKSTDVRDVAAVVSKQNKDGTSTIVISGVGVEVMSIGSLEREKVNEIGPKPLH